MLRPSARRMKPRMRCESAADRARARLARRKCATNSYCLDDCSAIRLQPLHDVSAGKHSPARLKNCTAFSCFLALASDENVPRLRRLPVLGFFLREYRRYPDLVLRIMIV